MRAWLRVLLLVVAVLAGGARADEFRPAYLELVQVDARSWDVLWKLPARDEATTLGIRPVFPEGTVALAPVRSTYAAGTAVQRWRIAIEGGLAGREIAVENRSGTSLDVLVRVVRADGGTQVERLPPVSPRFVVRGAPGGFEVARTYVVLGVEHILTGFDHLLFVLALVLLVRGARRLVATVTAFTLAHSITLALASLGVVHVPGPPVEAAIALSIVFVAVELVHLRRGRLGFSARNPWVVAFSFGLLHGLGFAGALAQVGLPDGAIGVALLFFNVGVEIGQLVFVAAVMAARAASRGLVARLPVASRERVAALPVYAIGGLASFWLMQRIAAF